MPLVIPAAAATLADGATTPDFATFFVGARFFSEPQEGGGIFALAPSGQTNRVLYGPGGNDVGSGGDGTDVLFGDDGDDNLQGGAGNDFVFGGDGDDIVRGDAGDDVVVGQEGSDQALAGPGADIFEFFASQFAPGEIDVILDFESDRDAVVVVGSTDVSYDPVLGLISVDGDEVIEIAPGLETQVITRANSAIIVGATADLSELGVADDPLTEAEAAAIVDGALVNQAAPSTETALGTLLADSTAPGFVTFFAGARFVDAPSAEGGVFVQGQDDETNVILFAAGDDVIGGNDVATGASGVDIIQSGDGDDNIQGAAGADFVFGGLGDDIVRGDEGDDVLVGQEGSDIAIGGSGADIFEFFAGQFTEGELDTILDFNVDEDAVVVVGSTDVAYDPVSGLVSAGGVDLVEIAPGLETQVVTRANSAVIVGASTDLSGFGVADAPVDETLEDALVELPADTSSAEATLLAGSTAPAFVSFFAGARFFEDIQADGGVFVRGEDGQDNVLLLGGSTDGFAANDVVTGGDGTDIIQSGDGDDNIQGSFGDDFLFGGFGDDIVRGDEGDDVLVGQEGSDIAIGGAGSDVFEFFADQFAEGELDLILDFETDLDQIVVVGSTDVSYDPVTGLVSVDGVELVEVAADLDLEVTIRENSAAIVGADVLPGDPGDLAVDAGPDAGPDEDDDADEPVVDVEEPVVDDGDDDGLAPATIVAGGSASLALGAAATEATLAFTEIDDASGSNARFDITALLDGVEVGLLELRGATRIAEPGGTLDVSFDGQAFDELVVSDAEGDVTALVALAPSDDLLV